MHCNKILERGRKSLNMMHTKREICANIVLWTSMVRKIKLMCGGVQSKFNFFNLWVVGATKGIPTPYMVNSGVALLKEK